MSIQKHLEKKDSAVSPVVGVMLMLVVTIVVAAVVAMSAMGTFSDAQTGSTVVLKLDDCTMKVADFDPDYTGPVPLYSLADDDEPFVDSVGLATNPNYAPYEMKFRNMGGDTLSIDDLTLRINYNATVYKTPFKIVTKETTWSPGKVIVLNAREASVCPTEAGVGNAVWVLGLSQQDMSHGPKYFDWSIIDRSGNVIAKGTVYLPAEMKGVVNHFALTVQKGKLFSNYLEEKIDGFGGEVELEDADNADLNNIKESLEVGDDGKIMVESMDDIVYTFTKDGNGVKAGDILTIKIKPAA